MALELILNSLWKGYVSSRKMYFLVEWYGWDRKVSHRPHRRKSFQREQLVTVSFFRRGEGDRGNATKFFPTIARQLATRTPDLTASLSNAFSMDPDVAKKSRRIQFQELFLKPLIGLEKARMQF